MRSRKLLPKWRAWITEKKGKNIFNKRRNRDRRSIIFFGSMPLLMYILIALLARLGRFFLPPLIHFITLHSSLLLIRVFVCLFSFFFCRGWSSKNAARAKQLSLGRKKFNMDPKKGIEFLVQQGLLQNTPQDVAAFLYRYPYL